MFPIFLEERVLTKKNGNVQRPRMRSRLDRKTSKTHFDLKNTISKATWKYRLYHLYRTKIFLETKNFFLGKKIFLSREKNIFSSENLFFDRGFFLRI